MRNIGAGETKLISGSPLSGPSCGAALIRSTADAVFFWTKSRLSSDDSPPAGCSLEGAGDVYRYDLGDDSVKCVTCVTSGIAADVSVLGRLDQSIAIPDDGSRVYFNSPNALLPDAGPGIYRVDVASGDLAYVGARAPVGDVGRSGEAISPDGSVLIFASDSPHFDALGGQQNGGTQQYYRYDDRDRSLVCVSCPQGGSFPSAGVATPISADLFETGPNTTPLSSDGETFAFATPTPLVNTDQNTPGAGQNAQPGGDVYEWRDGKVLLVTDGLTSWPGGEAPKVDGVGRSGRDIYFTAAAKYTPDALDSFSRLYDARVGGGFEFPPPPKPCPLEVCQGTPKGAPEEAPPGSASLLGPGNAARSAKHKKKTHKKRRRHNRAHHQRARHDRRVAR
jgi:hypothetical protein